MVMCARVIANAHLTAAPVSTAPVSRAPVSTATVAADAVLIRRIDGLSRFNMLCRGVEGSEFHKIESFYV
ncbi:hypothetical protein T492DRAFT_336765 [Pavlovales sp. CCMP2436]|nr:hypothetical protein T492DRAFT_336765 [Pavlovales sp. CCMP2436]